MVILGVVLVQQNQIVWFVQQVQMHVQDVKVDIIQMEVDVQHVNHKDAQMIVINQQVFVQNAKIIFTVLFW